MSVPHVVVLHPRSSRPHAQKFQAELDALNGVVLEQIAALGWTSELIACSETLVSRVRERVESASAVVIMGGEDVDPAFYGGESEYQEQGDHEPLSDRVQVEVIRLCVASAKPLLGICRGHQLINVAMGGTLVQHLPTSAVHRGEDQGFGPFTRHPVRLTEHGRKAFTEHDALIDGEVVFSTHHQAVQELGEGLKVVAIAPDGVVEAIAHVSAPVLGVQWHPEHPDAMGAPAARMLKYLLNNA